MKVKVRTSSGHSVETTLKTQKATIGRSNKCEVVVADESLSRYHATVEIKNGAFFVTDLGSANGVFIDGKRIEAHRPVQFKSFNHLSLGPHDCVIEDSEEFFSPPAPEPIKLELEAHPNEKTNSRKMKMIQTREAKEVAQEKARTSPIALKFIIMVVILAAAVVILMTLESNDESPISQETHQNK